MNYCNNCKKNVDPIDHGGRNSFSLWCPHCGSRVDGIQARYNAKYFGQLQNDNEYSEIVYSIEYKGETFILTKPKLELFAMAENVIVEFQEQRYVNESIRDMNLFATLLTEINCMYWDKAIDDKTASSYFSDIVATVLGRQNLDLACKIVADKLRQLKRPINFYVPVEKNP